MEEAIRIIVEKCSPETVVLAMECLKAYQHRQPHAREMYSDLLKQAFGERVEFSAEERAVLADALSMPAGEKRSELLQVRLTPAEKTMIEKAALAAGLTTSVYARRKLLEFK
jgi:phenylpyruvate tautomerase PptA (4-oxalocrotonate tautomerase family)